MCRTRPFALLCFSICVGCICACTKKHTGLCDSNGDCTAGQACFGGKCIVLCNTDRECAPAVCCAGACAKSCDGDLPPEISWVDSDGPTDGAPGHAAHQLGTRMTIHGAHLQSAAAYLSGTSLTQTSLEICNATDTQLEVELPGELTSGGDYTLRVVNAAGSCSATLPMLVGQDGAKGDPGVKGDPGPMGPPRLGIKSVDLPQNVNFDSPPAVLASISIYAPANGLVHLQGVANCSMPADPGAPESPLAYFRVDSIDAAYHRSVGRLTNSVWTTQISSSAVVSVSAGSHVLDFLVGVDDINNTLTGRYCHDVQFSATYVESPVPL